MKKLWKSLFVIGIGVFSYGIDIQEVQAAPKCTIITYKKHTVCKDGQAYEMMRHSKANRIIHEQNWIQMLPVRKLKFGEPLPPAGGKVEAPILLYQE